ncbi:MAG: DNA cytosine methyltransferase [Treponema sp.]|nr:DNA cytosine methyltransferase [Treponema sp.]
MLYWKNTSGAKQGGDIIKFIDLFAGAGGLSEGFTRVGFKDVAHIEMNPEAANTLKTRRAYWYLKENNSIDKYYSYLSGKKTRDELYSLIPDNIMASVINCTMDDKNIKELFKVIDKHLKSQGGESHVNLIVGGPPCQPYSLAGRARLRNKEISLKNCKSPADDSRKYLYRIYCQFLSYYKPDMFVFENVPGLLSADNGKHWQDIQQMLRSTGYEIADKELNARDFGVPQERKRIIIIGWRKQSQFSFPDFKPLKADWNVADILSDLPAIQAGEQDDEYKEEAPHQYVKKYLRTNKDVLTWHIARPHTEQDREIYRMAIREWCYRGQHRRLNYQNIPKHLQTHKNTTCFADRFKVVAPDIPYCHTVLAHLSKDGHYFIHPDPKQARSLTVREAARLQSFPDSYFFEGSRTSAFTQIGNAVPPLMAQHIAEALRKQLQG